MAAVKGLSPACAGQGYRLEVTPSGAFITAEASSGLYYGLTTLSQMTDSLPEGNCLPGVVVTDWPDLEDRGFWGGDSYDQLRWMSDR